MPISELQKYGDQLLKVNYIEMHSKQSFRHSRSNSFDQPPRNNSNEIDRVVDLTQRISLDDATYRPHLNKRNSNHSIRTRVSTNQLNKENVQDPRQTRSTVNLQGFWKPNNTTSSPQENNRRLSLSSVHVPPFIPSSEAVGYYYYPVTIGIPTPPPSASPVHHQQPYHMYL